MSAKLVAMNLPRFPLLKEEEIKKLLRLAQNGDGLAREKLVNCNLKLVFNVVKRFQNRGHELEDLFQIGCIGLMKAIDKFNLNFEVKFSTYAVPMIIGEIRRFLRDDNPVRVSRTVKETAYRVQQARDRLTAVLGREPSIGELAEELGLPKEEVINAVEASQAVTSIYDTIHQDEGDPVYLVDQLDSGSDSGLPWLEELAVKELLNKLPERDRRIINWRFFEDRTQSDIACRLGISQVQVSRIERQALKKLKNLVTLDSGEEKI
ncbi:MAG: RNA polymerase sporulation sigma factor SigF [Peptococcaceae bacterium]|nr:MAG: RNA polymerase sporulation sigma factor SigF [Peptococcaceae bacterium]